MFVSSETLTELVFRTTGSRLASQPGHLLSLKPPYTTLEFMYSQAVSLGPHLTVGNETVISSVANKSRSSQCHITELLAQVRHLVVSVSALLPVSLVLSHTAACPTIGPFSAGRGRRCPANLADFSALSPQKQMREEG